MSVNSADPDLMPQSVASDLGLHCLVRSVSPCTQSKYNNCVKSNFPLRNHPGSTPELQIKMISFFNSEVWIFFLFLYKKIKKKKK